MLFRRLFSTPPPPSLLRCVAYCLDRTVDLRKVSALFGKETDGEESGQKTLQFVHTSIGPEIHVSNRVQVRVKNMDRNKEEEGKKKGKGESNGMDLSEKNNKGKQMEKEGNEKNGATWKVETEKREEKEGGKVDEKSADRLEGELESELSREKRDFIHGKVANAGVDVFFFPYGSFVVWGGTPELEAMVLAKLKSLGGEKEHHLGGWKGNSNETRLEFENYTYRIGEVNTIDLKRDSLVLQKDDYSTRLSYSFALAASVRLNMNELILEEIIHEIPSLSMANSKNLKKKFLISALDQVRELKMSNLSILDVPDYFWEHPTSEKLHEMVQGYCSISPRIRLLNEKIDHVWNLIQMQLDDMKHAHSIQLEEIIIALISVEVYFVIYDHFPFEWFNKLL